MKRGLLLWIVGLVFGASLLARWMFYVAPEDLAPAPEPGGSYARIVSMAPSITETLFALGLGNRVVGVTRYCLYPPEATEKAQVGGFLDPSYEAVVALEPDLAIILTIHSEAKERLAGLNIPTLVVDHRTLDGVLDSFRVIAQTCGQPEAGDALAETTQARIDRVRAATQGLDRPRVLLSSARNLGSGRVETVYAAGQGQWYDELIEAAGGVNAFDIKGVQFPALSGEGLLRMDPDVILELAPELAKRSYTREAIVAEWSNLSDMRAVREGRVHVLAGDYVAIPGPRLVITLEDMAKALHPEVDWSTP